MDKTKPSRREFLQLAGVASLGLLLPPPPRALARLYPVPGSRLVYIGTYTSGRSEGIYVCRLDLSSGELRRIAIAKGVVNPSFLTIDRQGKYLYAVNEISEFEKKASGAVSSFRIDQKTGTLSFINQQPSAGSGPCHLTLDATGKYLLVANYDAGSVASLPVTAGGLLAPVAVVQHHGSSVNVSRQQGPHAHGVVLDRANRYLFVPDLGLDQLVVYRFDARLGGLTTRPESPVKLKPGAGPRHFAFHTSERWGYVINEIDSTITAFSYDPVHGALHEMQTISTLPADFSGENSCAEVAVSPSGKFVYGSNRGHDSIVVYSVDQGNGKLSLIQHVSTQGKTPRNFAIDPAGDFLLAANQNSDSVVTFRIDRSAGTLAPTGHVTEIPAPVCLVMSEKL